MNGRNFASAAVFRLPFSVNSQLVQHGLRICVFVGREGKVISKQHVVTVKPGMPVSTPHALPISHAVTSCIDQVFISYLHQEDVFRFFWTTRLLFGVDTPEGPPTPQPPFQCPHQTKKGTILLLFK